MGEIKWAQWDDLIGWYISRKDPRADDPNRQFSSIQKQRFWGALGAY